MTFDIATGTSMMFLGPILGGFLMRDVGIQGFYFVAAACFAGAFLCVLAIRFKPEAAVVTRDRLGQVIADGFRHLRRNPPVAGVLADRFGTRRTAAFGAAVASAGMLASSFSVDQVWTFAPF